MTKYQSELSPVDHMPVGPRHAVLMRLEHQGMHGVITEKWIYSGELVYHVSVWTWCSNRAERARDLAVELQYDQSEIERYTMWSGWKQHGTTRIIGSRHSAEAALLDLLEYPALTALKCM
jgi:hypothetical protein